MKIGNLAVVVAMHPEAKMVVWDGLVEVSTPQGVVSCPVDDSDQITKIIAWLNFGDMAVFEGAEQHA